MLCMMLYVHISYVMMCKNCKGKHITIMTTNCFSVYSLLRLTLAVTSSCHYLVIVQLAMQPVALLAHHSNWNGSLEQRTSVGVCTVAHSLPANTARLNTASKTD